MRPLKIKSAVIIPACVAVVALAALATALVPPIVVVVGCAICGELLTLLI